MGLDPKVFQKFPLRLNKKHQVNSKNLERGKTMKKKRKPLGKTSKENTKSHLDIPQFQEHIYMPNILV
jgi:hypothetical protein